MSDKRILLFCVLLSILALCVCSKNEPTEKIVKVFAPSWFLAEADAGVAQSLSVFKREFPDVRVEFIAAAGRWEQVLQKLILMCASGEMPDVVWFRPEWGEVIAKKCVAPVEDADLSAYFPKLAEAAIYDGKIYGVPYEVGVRVVWLRFDVFKSAGIDAPTAAWTVDEFLDVLSKLQNYDGKKNFKYAFAFPAADDIRSAYQALALISSFGGELNDLKGERTKIAVKKLFRFYRTAVERGSAPKEIYQSSQGLVYSGLREKWYASAVGGSWEKKGFKEAGIDVVPVFPPVMESAQKSATYADVWAVGLSPVGISKKAALRLVEILTSKESQRVRVGDALLSARSDAYSSQSPWLSLLEHSQTLQVTGESLQFLESLARAIHLVAKGDWTEDEAVKYVFGDGVEK